jgi:hypothetical protein
VSGYEWEIEVVFASGLVGGDGVIGRCLSGAKGRGCWYNKVDGGVACVV